MGTIALKTTIETIATEINSVLTGLGSYNLVSEGRLETVKTFPCVFYWTDGRIEMKGDYLTGDLVRLRWIIAAYDYSPSSYDAYKEVEDRSKDLAADLRDEFSKWENRTLNGSCYQARVAEMVVDPGEAPGEIGGGLMAAGGIELITVFRAARGG